MKYQYQNLIRSKSLKISFLASALLLGAASADTHNHASTQVEDLAVKQHTGKVKVTATVNMVTDLARVVGGNRVAVTGLMGPGIDPHLYKPSAGDIARLNDADLVFYAGLHLEGKMVEILEKSNKAIAVSDRIPRQQLIQPEGGFDGIPGLYDPHIWFDVTLWKQTVPLVRDALIQVDPQGRNYYTSNAANYLKRLDGLDRSVQSYINRVPKQQRVMVTAHDAFNYFGRRYGMEVRGVQGISTASEAGTRDIQDIANFVSDRQIPAIFVESSVPRRTVEAVIQAANAKGHQLRVGGELYSDALGEEGTAEGTYLGMMLHNASTISKSLSR